MSLSEAAVQTAIRIRASELGIPLFRNNVGACEDLTGRLVRYGLANDSAAMQRRIKSGDLVGILPRDVTTDHSNIRTKRTFGVFLSVECKKQDWHGDPARFNDREKAQQAWIDHVRAHGGAAGFARSVAEFEALICHNPT